MLDGEVHKRDLGSATFPHPRLAHKQTASVVGVGRYLPVMVRSAGGRCGNCSSALIRSQPDLQYSGACGFHPKLEMVSVADRHDKVIRLVVRVLLFLCPFSLAQGRSLIAWRRLFFRACFPPTPARSAVWWRRTVSFLLQSRLVSLRTKRQART